MFLIIAAIGFVAVIILFCCKVIPVVQAMLSCFIIIFAWFAVLGTAEQSDAWNETSSVSKPLRAVAYSEGATRHYLLSGTSEASPEFRYMAQEDDGHTALKTAPAETAKVFEDSEKPTVKVIQQELKNLWIAPFAVSAREVYEFHLPEGSVVENTAISLD